MTEPLQKEAGFRGTLLAFLSDDSGTTAIEYAMVASGIAGAIVLAVYAIGPTVQAQFTSVNSGFQ